MLDEPRLLLPRALDPLNPRDPPSNAVRFPAPERDKLRLPIESGPPVRPPPRPEAPERLPKPLPPAPPILRSPRLLGGLLVRLPPCLEIC
jgi:hypothetical protein